MKKKVAIGALMVMLLGALVIWKSGKGKFDGNRRTSRIEHHRIERNKNNVLIHDFCEHTKHFPEHHRLWKPFLSALERYRRFHHSQLMVLEQQNFNISHNNKSSGSIRTLTWSCDHSLQMCSGLGARFRNILSAFVYALITNRVFLIHLGDIDKSMMLIDTNKINWSFFSEKLGMHKYNDFQLTRATRSCSNTAKLQHLLKSNIPHVTLSFSFGGLCLGDPWIQKGLSALGLSPLMKKSNFADLLAGVIWRFLFTLPGNLVADVKHIEESFRLKSRNYVAVHIRTGFVGSVFEERVNNTPKKIQKDEESWEDTMKCSLKLADEHVGKNSPVFLATDSHKVKDWTLKKDYGRRIRTSQIKNIVHSDHPKTWKRVDSSAFRDMWTDILLLAKGKLIVLSHSGFSHFALQLCSQQPAFC